MGTSNDGSLVLLADSEPPEMGAVVLLVCTGRPNSQGRKRVDCRSTRAANLSLVPRAAQKPVTYWWIRFIR